jgi:hypothetical protein
VAVPVKLDDGAVDHGVFHVRIVRQGLEDAAEHAALHPVRKPLVDGVPRCELARQIAPRGPGSNDPQHRLDEHPRVAAGPPRIAGLAQAVQFDLRPLGVTEDKTNHFKLPF